jgi:large subunit ribosomal protein L30
MAKLYITRRKSLIQSKPNQVKTAKALGLTRMHKTVIKNDTPTIRGMIKVVSHLVDVVEK